LPALWKNCGKQRSSNSAAALTSRSFGRAVYERASGNVADARRAFTVQRNLESLSELLSYGKKVGVGIMVENLPDRFNTAQQLSELLDALPELGLHLDIGHANLMTR